MNVTSIDKGVWLSVGITFSVVNGCVDGVRETVDKHPCKADISQFFHNVFYLFLDSIRTEQAFSLFRTIVNLQDVSLNCRNGRSLNGVRQY